MSEGKTQQTDFSINDSTHEAIMTSNASENSVLNDQKYLDKLKKRQSQYIHSTHDYEICDPMSCTDQSNSIDETFEPTVDMLVNDFDDEQTLNEEEALEETEQKNTVEEIATLHEESKMPIEELLAKYRETVPAVHLNTTNNKKYNYNSNKYLNNEDNCSKKNNQRVPGHQYNYIETEITEDVIVIDSGDDEDNNLTTKQRNNKVSQMNVSCCPSVTELHLKNSPHKQKRSQLMSLYPDHAFSEYKTPGYTLESDVSENEGFENDETDTDYVKKTIMVGSTYQAVIPTSLSKYGDVLPYENEDKLIWEPSQVSEMEVEDYLIKTQEIKNFLTVKERCYEKEESVHENDGNNICSSMLSRLEENTKHNSQQQTGVLTKIASSEIEKHKFKEVTNEGEVTKVVKDNEQALHLLVQCGYDFKEALRRKRLNAVPLAGSMSMWSDEECRKFEEGIHKFGKDFFQIRQHLVRTRTMRELVQFYYIWKKSERRDHNYADSDTVNHMDIYLNEGDYR